MKSKLALTLFIISVLCLTGSSRAVARGQALATVLGTAITYQGRLTDGGVAANAQYDFRFILYNAESGGSQVGSQVAKENVQVSDGYFTVQLDFGADSFVNEARWLEVAVRPGTSTGTYSVLSPRQALTPAPFALYSSNAGSVPWSGLTGVPANLANGVWSLTGNAGTNPSTNYLGTSDNQAFEIRVNGQRALRLEPNATSSNLLGGFSGNTITAGVIGATIGGGGSINVPNRVTDDGGTVSGGANNQAGDNSGTTSDAETASVGGGLGNTASGPYATVSGGFTNTASGSQSVVGGGGENLAQGVLSTIGGGAYNLTQADFATIGGGGPSDLPNSTTTNNRVYDNYGTIGGGGSNRAGSDDSITTSAQFATVGGGRINQAIAQSATVSGGWVNTASGNAATVPGGANNVASGDYSFAAGAQANASASGSFVWADTTSHSFDPISYPEPGGVANSFNVRATGGVYFVTGVNLSTGEPTSGVWLSSSGWNNYSDRAAKMNFLSVDSLDLLERLAGLPISSWNYKTQSASVRHIGPMAQDFNAAFDLGETDKSGDKKYINSIDADGVALAAIQGLYQLNQAQAAEIQSLKAQLSHMENAGDKDSSNAVPLLWVFVALLGISQVGMFFFLRRRMGGKS